MLLLFVCLVVLMNEDGINSEVRGYVDVVADFLLLFDEDDWRLNNDEGSEHGRMMLS